jgi:4-hydroxybenzoate polyprenyltransferase
VKRTVRGLLIACHPGPTLVVTLIAVLLSVSLDHSALRTTLIGIAVLLGQLSIGWSNDWLDAQRDARAYRLDKPTVAGVVTPKLLRGSAVAAATACAAFSIANGWWAAVAHSFLVGSGWVYNAWLKPTIWSWLPYAVGFGALPVFVTLSGPSGFVAPWWQILAGALLGVGAHFANVLPDLERDRESSIDGLPQRLGLSRSAVVSFSLLAGSSVLVTVMSEPDGWVLPTSALLAVAALSLVGLSSIRTEDTAHRAFTCAMGVALLTTLMFVTSG